MTTPCAWSSSEVSPEQSKPKPDRPAHRYGRPLNICAVRTTSVPVRGSAGTPGAWTETALADSRSTRPVGAATLTHPPAAPTHGSRVPKLISVTGLAAASSVRRNVVRAVTVASRDDAAGRAAVSWLVGTHPGYPRGSSGVGWSGTTTLTHDPLRATTTTRSPSRAWVSARPLRPRRSVSVICPSHCRIAAGLASAGRSTVRAKVGARHTVATETATQASRPTVTGGAAGAGGGAVGDAGRETFLEGDTPPEDVVGEGVPDVPVGVALAPLVAGGVRDAAQGVRDPA